MENLENGDERLAHIYNELDSIIRRRGIREPLVLISGSVARQTSKARAPSIQSMSTSDRVSISVAHADQKKGQAT
jgi:hypothetical protein